MFYGGMHCTSGKMVGRKEGSAAAVMLFQFLGQLSLCSKICRGSDIYGFSVAIKSCSRAVVVSFRVKLRKF